MRPSSNCQSASVLVIKLRKRCSVCVFLYNWGKGTVGSREESERAPHLSVAVVPDGTERGGVEGGYRACRIPCQLGNFARERGREGVSCRQPKQLCVCVSLTVHAVY